MPLEILWLNIWSIIYMRSYTVFSQRWHSYDFFLFLFFPHFRNPRSRQLLCLVQSLNHLRPEREKNHLNIATGQCWQWELNPGCQHSKQERYTLHHYLPDLIELLIIIVRDSNLRFHKNRLNVFQRISGIFRNPVCKAAVNAGIFQRIKIRQHKSWSVGSDLSNFQSIRDPVSDPTCARSILSGVPSRDFSAAAIAAIGVSRFLPPLSKPKRSL